MSRKKPVSLAQQYPQAVLAVDDVDDPYERGAKLRIVRNVREHPIAMLAHMGRITEAQRIAGMEFCRRFEAASIGQQQAIDYSRTRVDGGGAIEPLPERIQEAVEWLNSLARASGTSKVGFAILSQICGEGRGIQETALRFHNSGCPKGRAGDGWVLGILVSALEGVLDFMERPRR